MDKTEVSKTISVLSLASLAGFFLFKASWLLWLSALLTAGNVFENRITLLIATYWIKFATFLGHVNSKIILTVVFYLVLTPFAILYRIFNKASVESFLRNKRTSNFEDCTAEIKKESFEKVW